MDNILYIIPARGGSKGIPYKNIKPLAGKPLIYYSIAVARELTQDENICVSTDDDKIIEVVESYGLRVPFKRPAHLATDNATTNDVLMHAVDFYERGGKYYNIIVLLQPTSPFRTTLHVKEALQLFRYDLDMVVSVRKSHSASLICRESLDGYLKLVINRNAVRRQEINGFYEFNGAIYIINVERLKRKSLSRCTFNRKYVMEDADSIDIDTQLDWDFAEFLLNSRE